MSAPALAVRRLTKRYGAVEALSSCSVEIPQRRVAALIGANGAGKSTLLRCAAGLSRPSSGSLEILGSDIRAITSDQLAMIGYLDQDRLLFPGFTVGEILRFGAHANPRWDQSIATRHLGSAGIRLSSRIKSLSGGQQSQVGIALALAKRPQLLLLDEPVSSLDPIARQDLLGQLMHEVANSEVSVVLSTHTLGDAAAVCDFIVVMSAGAVVLAEETEFVEATHLLISTHSDDLPLPQGCTAIETKRVARATTYLVRSTLPLVEPGWKVDRPSLEEIVIAYLRSSKRQSQ